MKWLVVGLGNPEGKYFDTWHNVGFRAVEMLCSSEFKTKRGQNYLMAENNDTVFIKPLTYMNRSGEAVAAVSRKGKIPINNIIVLTDDLHIDKGKIKVVRGGSHAGHNGIRSINDIMQDNAYIKIRIGIKPEKDVDIKKYVLTKVDSPIAIEEAVIATRMIIQGENLLNVQSKFNTKNDSM